MIRIFSASSGLNTKTDPSRIEFNANSGLSDLAVAVNIVHDDTGRISRRKGVSATAMTDACHSLWSYGQTCLFASGTELRSFNPDGSYTVVGAVTSGARIRYANVGDSIYWVNGFETGKLINGIPIDWEVGTYYGPATNRRFVGPRPGHLIAYHLGRIFIAQENVVWYSEAYSDNLFDLTRNFLPMTGRVRLLISTGNALFVGDEHSTWALRGMAGTDSATFNRVSNYGAIEGTDTLLDLSDVGDSRLKGIGAVWTSEKAICMGVDSGEVYDMTSAKNDMPQAAKGASFVIGDNYITTLE